MQFNRFTGAIFCLVIVVPCGWMMFKILDHHCKEPSAKECQLLWLTAIISVLGGILFVEFLLARKKARGEWPASHHQEGGEAPFSSHLWIWARPLGQILLMSLMASLSAFIQGAFVLTVLGLIVGAFTDGLAQVILNRLPHLSSGSVGTDIAISCSAKMGFLSSKPRY